MNGREPRVSRVLAVFGLVIIVAGAAGFVMNRLGLLSSQTVTAKNLGRVLLVAASPDETGSVVGQIIVIVDVRDPSVAPEALSPTLRVSIPGTSYTDLADAYPFGGGKATAEALAGVRRERPLPYVAVGPDALASAVAGAGGARIVVPQTMEVFDGQKLFQFSADEQHVGADQFEAVMKGAPYLTANERKSLDASLADALIKVLASQPTVLTKADTDLDADALARLQTALEDRVGEP